MSLTDIHTEQEKEKRKAPSLAKKPLAPGNPQEFEQLFKQYYKELCRHSLRFVKQEEVAEELVQDVFIKVWQKKQQHNGPESIKAYLYTAVRNSSMNYLKSQFARQKFEDHKSTQNYLQTESTEEKLNYLELSLLVDEAVERLPRQCRTIFEMSRSSGFSHEEIAKEMQISPKTVENQIGIALKKLKKHLQTYWDIIIVLLIMLSQTNGDL